MKFKIIPGVKGKIFVPESEKERFRKHRCPDCYYCQNCGNERCSVCLGKTVLKDDRKFCSGREKKIF